MKRPALLWLTVLVLGPLLSGGLWAYRSHKATQQTGVAVYHALDDDGMPLPKGVLDDPAFKSLPPPKAPPSLGRYKPSAPPAAHQAPPAVAQAVTPPTAGQAVQHPPSASEDKTPSAQGSAQPAASQAPGNAPSADKAPLGAFQARNTTPLSQQKIHILLLGNDQEQLGSGRADTLLTLTFDPQAKTLYMVSVPRDTRVLLPGHGLVKINAAYSYGGASLQTTAVERFLGIPFDKYVEVSWGGFRRAIDAVGGVQLNTTLPFTVDGHFYAPGPQLLNGRSALWYSRERHTDPQGDLGRNERQQTVVRSLMNALGQLSPPRLNEVVQRLSSDVRTDFSPSEVVRLRVAHSYALEQQKAVKLQGVNRKINGLWYYVVSDAERQRLHLLLR